MIENIHKFIRNKYGQDSLKQVRIYERTARKVADFRNHLRFHLRCLKEDCMPRSIRLSPNVTGHRADKILRSAEHKLLNERITQNNFYIGVLNAKSSDIQESLFTSLSSDEYDTVMEFTKKGQMSQHERTEQRHVDKFEWLSLKSRSDEDTDWRSKGAKESTEIQKKWARNLSDRQLTQHELSALSKGMNYAVVPERKPVVELVTATETAIHEAGLNISQAEELRFKVGNTIKNTRLPPPNLSREERKALSGIRKDDSIVSLPADKGRCVVVLNKKDYISKCKD